MILIVDGVVLIPFYALYVSETVRINRRRYPCRLCHGVRNAEYGQCTSGKCISFHQMRSGGTGKILLKALLRQTVLPYNK